MAKGTLGYGYNALGAIARVTGLVSTEETKSVIKTAKPKPESKQVSEVKEKTERNMGNFWGWW